MMNLTNRNKAQSRPRSNRTNSRRRPVLITGGAGFIGANLAHRFLSSGQRVILYDNLSRPGVKRNVEWLRSTHGDLVELIVANVEDAATLRRVARRAGWVFHFAAQVAVTTSLQDPIRDFEVNARGTLNLLEALRAAPEPPPLIYTSTNKVYGNMHDIALRTCPTRYEPLDNRLRKYGFDETRQLDFHSPYGCSKGAACQYVLDYSRTYGLRTVAFHMSCIYGLHQFGCEDQGWVAHFLIRALAKAPITIYGDGRQVRDILFVEDLIRAFLLAGEHMEEIAGQSFNIGGGPTNTVSLLELLDFITEIQGHRPECRFEAWRSADQRYYVSDIRKFSAATGWRPNIGVREGVSRLHEWLGRVKPMLPVCGNPVQARNGHSRTLPPAPRNGRVCTNRMNGRRPAHDLIKTALR